MPITPVHGPFDTEELGSNERRRRVKGNIQAAVRNGNCGCEQCESREKPKGMPRPAVWSRNPEDKSEVWLCQGPDIEGAARSESFPG